MPDKYNYIRKTFTYEGRRYTVRGKTEAEAIRKMVEKQFELESGQATSGGRMRLRDWYMIAFDTYKPNISDAYRYECLQRFRKHVISDIGSYPLESITPLQCQQILNRQAGRSSSHINKLAQELHFVFEAARKNGMINKNPAADLIKPKAIAGKRRSLTPIEREHLLKVLPTDPRFIFFELMLYCGCRPGEAARVEYEDVTMIDGIAFLHIRGTKTANSDRFVPVPKEIYPKLVNVAQAGVCALSAANKPHTESTYKHMVNALKRALNISMGATVYRNQLIEPLPLAPDFTPYLLRHTYCTDLKKKGVDVRLASSLMGHSNIMTTANIYDHDDKDTLILSARQMGLA